MQTDLEHHVTHVNASYNHVPVMEPNLLQCRLMQHHSTCDNMESGDWKPDQLGNNLKGSNINFATNYSEAMNYLSCLMRKPAICICENKGADQLRGNRTFVFATRIVQFLFYSNPKFQASSSFLRWLICCRLLSSQSDFQTSNTDLGQWSITHFQIQTAGLASN